MEGTVPFPRTYHRGRAATGALCAIAYVKCNEEEDKRERRCSTEGAGGKERRSEMARSKRGKSGRKSLTVPRWDQREPTSDAAVGQHQQHLRTARCSSRVGVGGGGGWRSWVGEADDVESFELFRRPLQRM